MGRLIKWILVLVCVGLLTVVGYAFLGDLSAPEAEVTRQVTIEVD